MVQVTSTRGRAAPPYTGADSGFARRGRTPQGASAAPERTKAAAAAERASLSIRTSRSITPMGAGGRSGSAQRGAAAGGYRMPSPSRAPRAPAPASPVGAPPKSPTKWDLARRQPTPRGDRSPTSSSAGAAAGAAFSRQATPPPPPPPPPAQGNAPGVHTAPLSAKRAFSSRKGGIGADAAAVPERSRFARGGAGAVAGGRLETAGSTPPPPKLRSNSSQARGVPARAKAVRAATPPPSRGVVRAATPPPPAASAAAVTATVTPAHTHTHTPPTADDNSDTSTPSTAGSGSSGSAGALSPMGGTGMPLATSPRGVPSFPALQVCTRCDSHDGDDGEEDAGEKPSTPPTATPRSCIRVSSAGTPRTAHRVSFCAEMASVSIVSPGPQFIDTPPASPPTFSFDRAGGGAESPPVDDDDDTGSTPPPASLLGAMRDPYEEAERAMRAR